MIEHSIFFVIAGLMVEMLVMMLFFVPALCNGLKISENKAY